MDATISTDMEPFVAEQIAAGHFRNADSVVDAGLRALQADPLAAIKADIDEGLRQAEAGDFYEGTMDDIKREAREQWEAKRAES